MEHTEGLGQAAQVWVDGQLLTVCDSLSTPRQRCEPGSLDSVRFSYPSLEAFSWDRALRGNPSGKTRLDPVKKWSYVGYGKVVAIMPTTIDFGLLTMEDPNWTTDEKLIGRYVKVEIDRLEISRADEPDWPNDLK